MLEEYKQFVTVKTTGLDIKSGMPIDDWLQLGEQLKRVESGIQWWIGDWLNYGERNYGEKYTQGLDATDYSLKGLQNIAYVAGRVETSRRRELVPFSTHSEIASLEPDEQMQALDEIEQNHLSKNDTRKLVKHIKRGNLITDKQNTLDIKLGDFRQAKIEPDSVDFIISDLPYPIEFIDLFEDLGNKAMEWLKPGGFIALYSGEINLPEVFNKLSKTGLKYYWTFCLYHEGQTQLVMPRNVICRWKPILIYQKPPFSKLDDTRQDYLISKQREKVGHDWQQSESGAEALIEAFSHEGDVVLDPTCGAGTFVKIAHKLNRTAVGYEIDEQTYKIARSV